MQGVLFCCYFQCTFCMWLLSIHQIILKLQSEHTLNHILMESGYQVKNIGQKRSHKIKNLNVCLFFLSNIQTDVITAIIIITSINVGANMSHLACVITLSMDVAFSIISKAFIACIFLDLVEGQFQNTWYSVSSKIVFINKLLAAILSLLFMLSMIPWSNSVCSENELNSTFEILWRLAQVTVVMHHIFAMCLCVVWYIKRLNTVSKINVQSF